MTKVSHLIYIDDLKLIDKTVEELQKMQVVRNFSDDIHIESGLGKCAQIVIKKGKLTSTEKYKR
jgi:hypothetical protein